MNNDRRKAHVRKWKIEAKDGDGWQGVLDEVKAHLRLGTIVMMVNFGVHKSLPFIPIMSQMNAVHTLLYASLRYVSMLYSHLHLSFKWPLGFTFPH